MPISVNGRSSFSPSTNIAPSLAGIKPAVISIRVLLPQPDAPMMLTNSPGLISKSVGPSA